MTTGDDVDVAPADDQQTSEWIAVLAAANLDYRLSCEGGQWRIHLPLAQADAAHSELAAYEADDSSRESIGALPTDSGGLNIDSWSPAWVAGLLVAFYAWMGPAGHGSPIVEGGAMNTTRLFDGEWWRLLTALTLHSGPSHLAGNIVCLLLFGYAVCHVFGGGVGWLLILGTGLLGNAAAAMAHGPDHISVGASTACFGALGILSARQSIRQLKHTGLSSGIWSRTWIPVGAGFAILTLLGTGPQSDLMAHLFGFGAGLLLAMPIAWFGPPPLSNTAQQLLQLTALIILMTAWRLALVTSGPRCA